MHPWTFHSAGSLLFGRGVVARLGEVADRFKTKRAFVVTDQNLDRAGLVERVTEPLSIAGITVEVFTGSQPEPPVEVVRAAASAANAFNPDVVIGLGGGSNMDVAKIVAILLAHGGDAIDYIGEFKVPSPSKTLIAIPTTAGTGSEVSQAAVFTDTQRKMKVSCLSPYNRPAVAVVDPALTDGCPKQVTADSGIDALTHAIEALTAADNDEFHQRPGGPSVYQGKNPMADLMAHECIRLSGQFLRRAVKDGSDTEARDGMALAATLGGLAFANAGVALVHAMEYPVGGAVHVSHGAGNGLLLPHVMRYNRVRTMRAGEQINVLLTGDLGGKTDPADAVAELARDIGIPTRLRDLGVTEAMLPGFAESAFGLKRLMRTNPRIPTVEDILGIYRAAL